jgi:cysteine desulfurase
MLDEAREAVRELVGAPTARIVLTSGGTEADILAIRALAHLRRRSSGADVILGSALEHPAVRDTLASLGAEGFRVRALRVARQGIVDLDVFPPAQELANTALVVLMLANNETGVVQPVRHAAELARRHGVRVHCDAVQAAGKLPIDVAELGIDFLTLSAHKLGGPPGVGALVVGPEIEPVALLRGGGQEGRWRAGTENLPGIAGFGRACELTMADVGWADRVRQLRDRVEAQIAALAPQTRVFGREVERLPNTSCLTMPGVGNQTQLIDFDLAGIAVSAGSACSSGKVGPSHVLAAMGVEPEHAQSAIRVSLGWASTAQDVDRFVAVWSALDARTRGRAAA